MDRLNKCTLCNKKSLTPLIGYETSGELVQCSNCRMVFASMIPSESLLADHYGNYGMFAKLSETTIKRYNQLLDKFENYRKTNRILDVGCGEGFFLEQAIKRGWDVFGTEYAQQYIEICKNKGIHMNVGILDPSNYPVESFDIITSFEVLEHLIYPVNELKIFNTLLRKGGITYITTPNFNSLSRRIQGNRWSVISFPDHLSYFTAGTLHKALSQTGFEKIRVQTTGISIARTQQALFHPKEKENENPVTKNSHQPIDSVWQGRIENNSILKILKRIINMLLTSTRLGDGIKAIYTKI